MINPSETLPGDRGAPGTYFGYTDVVSYILGITYEIWEQRQVDTILDYYGKDIEVFSLEGITHGAGNMVSGTLATLASYPDRLLLGDDVIWSGDLERGFSSHRITSPMTNSGDTIFAPATGKKVRTMNIADCEISAGQITGEWLFRDNLALVTQLGVDPTTAAGMLADRMDDELTGWLRKEHERTTKGLPATALTIGEEGPDPHESFARRALEACWVSGDPSVLEQVYAPYAVMHRAPIRIFSGREKTSSHFGALREAFPDASLTLDHVCSQPFGEHGHHVAARWSVAAHHHGPFAGASPEGKPVYIVGATHWRLVNGQVVVEWTVFDEVSVHAQLLLGIG